MEKKVITLDPFINLAFSNVLAQDITYSRATRTTAAIPANSLFFSNIKKFFLNKSRSLMHSNSKSVTTICHCQETQATKSRTTS